VHGYDGWKPVVNFWQKCILDSNKIADLVQERRPVSNDAYKAMQKDYEHITDEWTQAAVFYTLNRCVHTGTGLTGGKTNWGDGNPRLTDGNIKNLRSFSAPTLEVKQADFSESLSKHEGSLFYLDPPYVDVGETLYDHSSGGFDHKKLAELLKSRDKWVLSYNNVEEVRDLYVGFPSSFPKWKYGIKRNDSTEILIFSKDLKNLSKD
jgi:DNA adenine methylase